MEERLFFHNLCAIVLRVDVSIEFAAIIDSSGKLIVGKSRNIVYNYKMPDKERYQSNSIINNTYLGTSLFKNELLSSKNIKSIVTLQSSLMDNSTFFRIIHLCDNIFLAYIPINEQNDKFLCVYFITDEYLEDVLSKMDRIFS